MRRRYFTSHIKLPIIFIIVSTFVIANETEDQNQSEQVNETNIVCFAANSKWICAPEDQQNIASAKALKSLESRSLEMGSFEVVIKPINIPKFNTKNTFDFTEKSNNDFGARSNTKSQLEKKQANTNNNVLVDPEIELKDTSANNPYSKLWSYQLIGVSSHQSAIRFVKQNKLNKEDVLILKSVRAGKEWWIVLFGLYKDKQTGLDNVDYIPANLNQPWLRPLKDLVVNGFIEKY